MLSKNSIITGLVLLLFFNVYAEKTDDKPNVLFIAVDDLKPNIGCFGDSLAITPNLDALAAKGIVFKNTYCQQAVCAPSRASLLTSRYPDQTEVWDLQTLIRDRNPDILTLPQHFKNNGYTAIGTGKIFDPRSVDKNLDTPSWNEFENAWDSKWYSSEAGKPSYAYATPSAKDTIALLEQEASDKGVNRRDYVRERYWPSLESADVPYDAYIDGALANVGIHYLEQLAGNAKPFFLAVGFKRPHLPFNAPTEFWDLYEREQFEIASFQKQAQNSPSIAYHNFNELRSYTDIPSRGNLSESKQKKLIHAYYAATSYIDHLIGMLTKKLTDLGLDENTIIVLWGDHGWHLGDHNLWCKHSNFEQATRAPLIVSYPGQPNKGATYLHPAEFTDIATTLCDLANIETPVDFEGESLRQAVENPDKQIREGALSQYPRNQYMGYSLRTDRYRYTKWVDKTSKAHYAAELYDYELDPLETVNQAGNPEYADIKNKLDSIVKARIQSPSTQERAYFQLKKTNENGDTVNVSNASIQFAEVEKNTNQNGEIVFTHVPGEYNYSIRKKGFNTTTGKIELEKDTVITVILEAEKYDITLNIQADWNKLPIPNAGVSIGKNHQASDESGNVFFSGVGYNQYSIEVQLENGWSQLFEDIEIFSDTVITLYVAEPKYSISVEVTNVITGETIYESSVQIDEFEKLTDSDGFARFSIPERKYKITVDHPNYSLISDSVSITKDTVLFFQLSPAFSTIKFRLREGTTPVNEAKISVTDTFEITNNLGIAYFRDWPAYSNYQYTVEKENYITLEDELFLVNDTTINLQIERLGTFIDSKNESELVFWPNPFQSELFFRTGQNSKNKFSILNSTGKLIQEFYLQSNEKKRINTKSWQSGIYFLRNHSKKNPSVFKIVKI